jgi:LuxR family maltose regulon positive regulatory protein
MALPILKTKLYPPPLRPTLVARARLIERLNAGQSLRLTLVSAPAGFGKTTLVSEWLRQDSTQPAAWLSLDEADNDLRRFLTYLLAAWQQLDATQDWRLHGLLQETQLPPSPLILTELINHLAELPHRVTLVLDDYQLITTQAIHEAMIFHVEHLPAHVRLTLISRSDPPFPLPRWRVRGQLVEVRANDLRFTMAEAARFLNDIMGLSLTTEDLAILESRIEGWIAGLQLAALSMQDRTDRRGFIQSFAGSHRYVVSYLTEEVLSLQPETRQTFLLQTAILDRFTADLCAAVAGQPLAGPLLEDLERANLFLIPLDDQGEWYRYHHLFAEVLRVHLKRAFSAETIAALYDRASAWFEEAGLIDEAVEYALAPPSSSLRSPVGGKEGEKPNRAVMLIERHAMAVVRRGESMRVRAWLARLPEALILTRPQLLLVQGWIWVMTGNPKAAAPYLARLAEHDLSQTMRGEAALLSSTMARFQGDMAGTRRYANQALDLLPSDDPNLRPVALFNLGLACKTQGDIATAQAMLAEAIRLGEMGQSYSMVLSALEAASELLLRQGQLAAVLQTGERALQVAARWGEPALPTAGLAPITMSEIFYERNDLDGAAQAAGRGLALVRFSIEQYVLVRGYGVLAQVAWARGDPAGAIEALRRAQDWFAQMQITGLNAAALLDAWQARLSLWQGQLTHAIRWAETVSLRGETDLGYFQRLTLARLRLALGRSDEWQAALSSLGRVARDCYQPPAP